MVPKYSPLTSDVNNCEDDTHDTCTYQVITSRSTQVHKNVDPIRYDSVHHIRRRFAKYGHETIDKVANELDKDSTCQIFNTSVFVSSLHPPISRAPSQLSPIYYSNSAFLCLLRCPLLLCFYTFICRSMGLLLQE